MHSPLGSSAGTFATQRSDGRLSKPLAPVAYFCDVACKARISVRVIFGGQTTGTGVEIFDYDNDSWPDIFVVNGTKLPGLPSGKVPTSHLYHNNHDRASLTLQKRP